MVIHNAKKHTTYTYTKRIATTSLLASFPMMKLEEHEKNISLCAISRKKNGGGKPILASFL